MTRKANLAKTYQAEICRHALDYPETREDHPWGETAFKVKEKAFVFMRCDENGLSASFRAVAPKTLVKKMDAPASTAAKTKAKAKRSRARR